MRSVYKLADYPAGLPLSSDDLVEFHAARLLLLLHFCGVKNQIDGLTKLAKLDFFVRYPDFFDKASAALKESERSAAQGVESAMVRHHYGPWDKRYYDVLAYLDGRELIEIRKEGEHAFVFMLTDQGMAVVAGLTKNPSFGELIEQMKRVKKVFGSKTGNYIKNLIYRVFDQEVAQRPLGQVIE